MTKLADRQILANALVRALPHPNPELSRHRPTPAGPPAHAARAVASAQSTGPTPRHRQGRAKRTGYFEAPQPGCRIESGQPNAAEAAAEAATADHFWRVSGLGEA